MSKARLLASAAAVATALLAFCPAEAQVIGPVSLFIGAGPGAMHARDYAPLGLNAMFAGETVLDRRLRVRLDAALHRFGYSPDKTAPCPATTYCAPPVTGPLTIIAITATFVYRDTTNANPWYAFGGLGTYSAPYTRDANSRIGLTGGVGFAAGASRRAFAEVRVHLPYDANGYGVFVPMTLGWKL
jgi:hypothetical protein